MNTKGCVLTLAGVALVAGVLVAIGGGIFIATASPETLADIPGTEAHELTQRCRARDASACTAFASVLERAHAPVARVEEYFVNGCTYGDDAACVALMDHCEAGGAWIAEPGILETLLVQCKNAGGRACTFVVEEASRTPRNESMVREAARAACQHHDYSLCERFAGMARRGEGGAPDPAAAREAWEKACDHAKLADACDAAAIMEAEGTGGPQDLTAAVANSATACDATAAHCWNAGEFAELRAWSECEPSLKVALESDVRVSDQPTLEQSSRSVVNVYTTPERYESVLKERGIIFRESYVETTRIPGQTYTNTRTEIDRYAAASMLVQNQSCAPVRVDVEMTFDFDGWDSVKRGAFAGAFTYFLARASGASKRESQDAALGMAASTATSGLTGRATLTLAPNEQNVLVAEVDTQSLFGNNRKMKSVRIDRFELTYPEGRRCTPQCLVDLRNLTGSAAAIRAKYEKACGEGQRTAVCDYLQAIRAGNEEHALQTSCHGGKPPNLQGACSRMKNASWLRAEEP